MSRTSALAALHAPPSALSGFPGLGRTSEGGEPLLARALGAVGDCARMAWWDGSAIGLHLNGLLGLFEAEGPGPGTGRGARCAAPRGRT